MRLLLVYKKVNNSGYKEPKEDYKVILRYYNCDHSRVLKA